MAKMVVYKTHDVLTAAMARMAFVFDHFDRIVVSVSSGKDSTVLYYLALQEAVARHRRIEVFFLDQEAEYASTVTLMSEMMGHEAVIPQWYQVPLLLTNASSHKQLFLNAWHDGEDWIHPLNPLAIHHIDGDYPSRFYPFFRWRESQCTGPTAFLVGLRSKESLTRFRAVTQNPGYENMGWSTRTEHPEAFRFYPLFDWTFGDVWRFIWENKLRYNHIYDQMFWKHGINASNMRVSNLIHEKSFKALVDLQEFEPETYDRLIRRLDGVHCAALYAKDRFVYSADQLPAAFPSWCEYRDYLLATTPIERTDRFRQRFARQKVNEYTCRDQCHQILINDWENNIPVKPDKRANLRARWWDKL